MRMQIWVDVEDVDPTLIDPHEVAEEIIEVYRENRTNNRFAVEFDSAEWGDK